MLGGGALLALGLGIALGLAIALGLGIGTALELALGLADSATIAGVSADPAAELAGDGDDPTLADSAGTAWPGVGEGWAEAGGSEAVGGAPLGEGDGSALGVGTGDGDEIEVTAAPYPGTRSLIVSPSTES